MGATGQFGENQILLSRAFCCFSENLSAANRAKPAKEN